MASKFYLHQGKNKKAENGRPWIYIDEINEYDGDYENGDIVEVYNHKTYFIGKGYIHDHSKITIRIMTRDINEEIDEEFFKRRFAAAWDYSKGNGVRRVNIYNANEGDIISKAINEEFNEAEYNIDELGFNAEEFIFNVSKVNSTGNADEKEGQYSFDIKSYEIKKL